MAGFVLVWICFGTIAGIVGARKGEAVLGFIVGFFLGPIGLLFVIASKGKRSSCPFCRELVQEDATVCKHCSSSLVSC